MKIADIVGRYWKDISSKSRKKSLKGDENDSFCCCYEQKKWKKRTYDLRPSPSDTNGSTRFFHEWIKIKNMWTLTYRCYGTTNEISYQYSKVKNEIFNIILQ